MKETKEIVENILRMEASDYDLTDPSEIVTSGKTIQIIRQEKHGANILPHDIEKVMEQESENEESDDCISVDDMETYESGQEIDVEAAELKEVIEKKRKKRNYVEFKKDYEKM